MMVIVNVVVVGTMATTMLLLLMVTINFFDLSKRFDGLE